MSPDGKGGLRAPPFIIDHKNFGGQSDDQDGIKAEAGEQPKRIAHYMGLVIPRDFTKQDIFESICDRLGSPEENRVGWKLLDQYE